ncbi:MAG TPA: 3-phosphoshikimate 1-carboxyvinyltransferase [Acidimicrobiales bacterium]|nr:3-phosphoshikimate 1-carboxyvinyltransferase [Acidimicrobiales bacterium]
MTNVATTCTVAGGRALSGRVRVPGDKSISHRALMLAALAPGRSRLGGLSDGEDVAGTARALEALGVEFSGPDVSAPEALHPPSHPLDMGNSGTTMRLLAGVLAARPWEVTLVGDQSLSRRPMDRVAVPLGAMGATVTGRGERCRPPLVISGGSLHGIDYIVPVPSAQVKSCVLLAGLGATGTTVVREAVPTRRHTEELLVLAGVDVAEADEDGAHVVRLIPGPLAPLDLDIPGDPSQAAFWSVAATVVAGSEVVVEAVYAGPGRRGFLDVLRRMGADIVEVPAGAAGAMGHCVDLHVHSAALHGTEVQAAEITGLDEVPALAVAAAVAEGPTVFRDVGELRVKESDRMAGVLALLHAFGAEAEAVGDDLVVAGGARLRPASFDAVGDHRLAMAGAVAALGAGPGESTVGSWQSVATSYRAFEAHLRALVGMGRREVGA